MTTLHRMNQPSRLAEKILLAMIGAAFFLLWAANAFGQSATTKPAFLIGVYKQPSSTFDKWKARGINTVYEWEPGSETKESFEKGAQDKKMCFIDTSKDFLPATLVAEVKQPWRLGHQQDDEPELITHINKPGSKIEDLRARYRAVKAAGGRMYMNLAGDTFINQWYQGFPLPDKTDASHWGHRAASDGYMGQCDSLVWDRYLQNRNQAGAFSLWDILMTRGRDWSISTDVPLGRGQIVVIEAAYDGAYGIPPRGYLRSQVMYVLGYCARNGIKVEGVIYWTHAMYGGVWKGFDGLTPDVVQEMTDLNAELTAMATGVMIPTRVSDTVVADLQSQVNDLSAKLTASNIALTAAKADSAALREWAASIPQPK